MNKKRINELGAKMPKSNPYKEPKRPSKPLTPKKPNNPWDKGGWEEPEEVPTEKRKAYDPNNWKNESRNMNKKIIRLTESDLHRIVKESVQRILAENGENEISYGLAKRAYDKMNSLGQEERAGNLQKTFKTVNDDDDARYDLKNNLLYMSDGEGEYDNEAGACFMNHDGKFADTGYGNLPSIYSSSGKDRVRTNDPRRVRNRARHATNFMGQSVDKNMFRK